MLKKLIHIFIFFVLLPANSQAEKSIEYLQLFLDKTNSLETQFEQKLFDTRGVLLQQSAGTFKLKRPGHFVWDYILPYPQKIISNGKTIWIFDSELEQVTIKPYQQMLTGTPVLLLENNHKLSDDFQLVDLGLDNNQYWLSLIPKSSDKAFREIIIGVSKYGLHTMKLIDGFEQTTIIEFKNMIINPTLDDAQFDFKIPKGVDVVGGA